MWRKLFLISMAFFFLSCSKDYLFFRDQEKISKALKDIKDTDQSVRFSSTILLQSKFRIRTMYSITDSLRLAGVTPEKVVAFDNSKIPSIDDQVKKLSDLDREEYYKLSERSNKVMTIIDSLNSQKLYFIIKKYGFPSFDNRKWSYESNKVGITYVLTHINPKSNIGRKILKLMIKEYEKGRVNEGEMQHYLWHVDGRKNGPPYSYVVNIEEWRKRIK